MAPSRQKDGEFDEAQDEFDREEEDFLDDDDSGDEFQATPSLPRLRVKLPSRGSAAAPAAKPAAPNGKDKRKGKPNGKDTGYSWEATYKRSWDNVQEDDSGSLEGAVRQMLEGQKRKRITRDVAPVQRGIIRHLVLLLDLSLSMQEKDLRPNRFDLTLQYAREFVTEYFDQNPIGQLSIIGTRNGIAERVAMMGGNTVDHVSSLSNKRKLEPRGEPSLQNALEMARSSLAHLPASNSREILAIFGSLTTCDPGNIHNTLKQLQKDNIRVSIVSLAAEVKIFKDVCTSTGGTFSVVLNEGHFHDCLFELVPPPAVQGKKRKQVGETGNEGIDLLQMAFPLRLPAHSDPTLCACHSRSRGSGYLCPRCGCKVCDVPTDCPVCGITIVMSTHLARSYHHLFPVGNWVAVPWNSVTSQSSKDCYSCHLYFPLPPSDSQEPLAQQKVAEEGANGLSPSSRYKCTRCGNHFCLECDAFVHEQLHVCPGCC